MADIKVIDMHKLDLYRAFYEVAMSGSISAASVGLHVTQPAVSYSIKSLEEELGVTLFQRTSRGVTLTHEGSLLLRYVEQAFNFLKLGEEKVAESRRLDSGEIHIVASETLCRHFLLPHLNVFRAQHPKVKLHVTNRPTRETIQSIAEGRADIGVVVSPNQRDDVEVIDVMSIQDCFVVGEALKHLAVGEVPLTALQNYPIIMLEKLSNTRNHLEALCASEYVTLLPEIELSSIDLIGEFVKHGFGVGMVVREFVATELEQNRLIEVYTTPVMPKRQLQLVHRRNTPLSWAANEFIKYCVGEI